MARLVIGSRGSQLALTQTRQVAAALCQAVPGLETHIEIIHTQGDKILDAPLSKVGGKGLFTKELEVALLEERIDLAIHSLKDLPTELPPGLMVGSVPKREDPHDVLVSNHYATIDKLPPHATVGTSSLRRRAQLLAYRDDLVVVDVRGNVDTRIRKVSDGDLDAVILARAGIVRIGRAEAVRFVIPETIMIPAPAQGALGLEIRSDDRRVGGIVAHIHDETAKVEITAERTCLSALEGGCQVPIGALARAANGNLTLTACVCSVDGATVLRVDERGAAADAAELGRRAAQRLLDMGAGELITALR